MIISFSGAPGAGKSTIAKKLAQKLDWPRYYMGAIMRQKAKERGMTLEEYSQLCERDSSIDKEVDKYQEELGKKEDNFIIEGRTSWHFIPHSLKLYLDVEESEGARRIYEEMQEKQDRNEGAAPEEVEEVVEKNRRRKESERKRYWEYFGIDASDKSNYDHVIDTTGLTPEEVFEKVYNIVISYLDDKDVSPKNKE
jgi:cytidylate kinase